jgi:hypothetical protein
MFLFFAFTALFISCENHNTTPDPDTHNPVVTLTAPTVGHMYSNGDTVHMSVQMSDEDDLHEGYIYLRSATDTLFYYQPYVHELDSYQLDTFWVVSGISMNTNAWVTAIALNHVEGADTTENSIVLMP